jgi:hypothetical protein
MDDVHRVTRYCHRRQLEKIQALVLWHYRHQEVSLMAALNDVAHDLLRLREIEWAIETLLIEAKQIFKRVSPGDDEKLRAHLAALVLVS